MGFNVALLKEVEVLGDRKFKIMLQYDFDQTITRVCRMVGERTYNKELTPEVVDEAIRGAFADLVAEFKKQTITMP